MSLELVSFNLCPFVQRSVITLLHKNQPHDITYIDLSEPPEWFKEISPLGKVPLLKSSGEVLFESAVINEYIDETTPNPLMPSDPLLRARNRAWIEFGSNLISVQYRLTIAKSEEDVASLSEEYEKLIAILENVIGEGPYFNGKDFSLVDTAYAPIFTREAILDDVIQLYSSEYPRISAWKSALLELPEVQNSVLENFRELFVVRFASQGSFLANKLAELDN